MVADRVRCAGRAGLIHGKRFSRCLHVCPDCGRHSPLSARQRLDQPLDAGTAEPLDAVRTVDDTLRFTGTRPYPDRLAEARAATGLDEAVVGVRGRIEDRPVVVAGTPPVAAAPAPQPAAVDAQSARPATSPPRTRAPGLRCVQAPTVGTFCHASEPGAPPSGTGPG